MQLIKTRHASKPPYYFKNLWLICIPLIMMGWLTACADGGGEVGQAAPIQIGVAAGTEFRPQVVLDDMGNVLVVWRGNSIWANYYQAGQGWHAPMQINNGDSFGSPALSMGSDGQAFAVWTQLDGIWANRFTAGSGWNGPEQVTSTFGSPVVGANESGSAIAAWTQFDGTSYNVGASRYTAGGGWTAEELVGPGATDYTDSPEVGLDSDGNGIVVWQQLDNGSLSGVWANRYAVGAGWGVPESLSSPFASSPHVHMTATGDAMVIWDDFTVWARRLLAASGWDAAVSIADPGSYGYAGFSQMSGDESGNALVVWNQYSDGKFRVYANRYEAGADWVMPELLEIERRRAHPSPSDTVLRFPHVGINATGTAVAVWLLDGTPNEIYTARYEVGQGWSAPRRVAMAENLSEPAIAVDAAGVAVVVWEQLENGQATVWASRWEKTPSVQP